MACEFQVKYSTGTWCNNTVVRYHVPGRLVKNNSTPWYDFFFFCVSPEYCHTTVTVLLYSLNDLSCRLLFYQSALVAWSFR